MKKRKEKLPSVKTIMSYWQTRHESGDFELSQEVNWSRPECFACGDDTRHLDRSHIVAEQFGGKSDASNLLLLCRHCHLNCPDVNDRETVMAWVNNQPAQVTRIFDWVSRAIKDSGLTGAELANIKTDSFIKDSLDIAGTHFGIGMKESTKAAALTVWLKRQRP